MTVLRLTVNPIKTLRNGEVKFKVGVERRSKRKQLDVFIKVIDDEKKTQELEAKKTGKDDSNVSPSWDAPYPEGVKKHKIHSPENEEDGARRDEGEEEKNKGELPT